MASHKPFPTVRTLDSETRLLALALTGEQLTLEAPSAEALAQAGWDAARLGELRRTRQAAGEPWPFPVPPEALRAIGYARFEARLQALRAELGLDGLVQRPASHRALDADERRLTAERPPHW